ncbi:hypothetical protein V6N13_149754 [Hibiscus sabdariffa]
MKAFSFYVENIPKALHWKGLRHVFARYGDVVDVFIARKLSKAGKKFGFVRFKKQEDANRAIVSLNGFVLNGAKLSVSMAKFAGGRVEWNRKLLGDIQGDIGKDDEEKYRTMTSERNKGPCVEGTESRIKEVVNQKIRKVLGHIEEEDLRKLKRCLVGESSTGVSISIIQNKLIKRGLGDIKVQRLGGKLYLHSFEDDDLFLMLKELNWSHLKEIFSNVMPWSEDIRGVDRFAWLVVSGIPLHCWNHVTIKRVAELWGTVEAFSENLDHSLDCEKVTVRISTNHKKTIDEAVELEVGNRSYNVIVVELENKIIYRQMGELEATKGTGREARYWKAHRSRSQRRRRRNFSRQLGMGTFKGRRSTQ